MTRYAVLLRGVNVGGGNRIAMADLRALLERRGCTDVRTYLQSGNAVVDHDGADLTAAVEQALTDELGLSVAVLVRTAAELDAVVEACPFEVADPKAVHAVFLGGPAPELDREALLPDRVEAGPGCLYVSYAGASHSSPVAKLLGQQAVRRRQQRAQLAHGARPAGAATGVRTRARAPAPRARRGP